VEAQVVAARQHHRRGQDQIGPELGVPARTVSRILRRHHCPYLHELDPLTGEVIRASKSTTVRYERDQPAELVHMDVKKIGRIPDGGGWRAHGRAARDPDRSKKVGFDYVHSLVDDHFRLAYSEVLPDEKGPTSAGFLTRAAAYFATRDITAIQWVMIDNAWAYKYSLRDVVAALDGRQVFIKPHCPGRTARSNGSTAHCKPSGPTDRCSPATPNAQPRSPMDRVLQHSTPPQLARRRPGGGDHRGVRDRVVLASFREEPNGALRDAVAAPAPAAPSAGSRRPLASSTGRGRLRPEPWRAATIHMDRATADLPPLPRPAVITR
jgi:hypothetical protein